MSAPAEPDPDALLRALQEGAGPPPLPPLRIASPLPSHRPGGVGAVISAGRRALMRLLAPALADLVGQLERDRHRQRAELGRLEARVAELERRDR